MAEDRKPVMSEEAPELSEFGLVDLIRAASQLGTVLATAATVVGKGVLSATAWVRQVVKPKQGEIEAAAWLKSLAEAPAYDCGPSDSSDCHTYGLQARLERAEADNAALVKAITDYWDACDREPIVGPDASIRWLNDLHAVSEVLRAIPSTPHPGTLTLDRLERLEAVVAAVRGSHYCARVPAVAVALAALERGGPDAADRD